jgi:hypothetical protein
MKVLSVNLQDNEIGAKRERVNNGFSSELAVIEPKTGQSIAIFRTYITGYTFHCCAWFHGADNYGSGYGKATGSGYCKESAAIDEAIANAGIALEKRFGGRGESAIRDAALAIGRKLTGKRNLILHKAHG